jgi:hypothetical protein
VAHLEQSIVARVPRANFCAAVPGTGEASGEAEGTTEAEATASAGRESAGAFRSTKKKKEEPEAAAEAVGFRDLRKKEDKPVAADALPATETTEVRGDGGGVISPPLTYSSGNPYAKLGPVASIPRDITKEELDALIAVAAKLDEPAVAAHTAIAYAPDVAAPTESFTAASGSLGHGQDAAQVPDFPASLANQITKEELDALGAAAARLDDSPVQTQPVSEPEQIQTLSAAGVVDATAETVAETTEEMLMTFGQAEPAHHAATDDQTELVPHAEPQEAATNPVNAAQFEEQPAPIDRNDEPMFVSARGEISGDDESVAPSDEELAEALRLLTPATGYTASHEGDGQVVARWKAEAVSVTPEEASMSLEAEMFRTFAPSPAKETEAAPVVEQAAVDQTSTIMAAVQDGLAQAAKQVELAAEATPRVMAAAASAETSTTSTEESDIASIVDRVLADLRPKIVEEIAKKLGKK